MEPLDVMLRFKDLNGIDSVDEHNKIIDSEGHVFWGLWLKFFENRDDIVKRLKNMNWPCSIYLADTTSFNDSEATETPRFYICEATALAEGCDIEGKFVPSYYRSEKDNIKIFFRIDQKIIKVKPHDDFKEIIGVPTIYFCGTQSGKTFPKHMQHTFSISVPRQKNIVLHLSDLHFGDDEFAFASPGKIFDRTQTERYAQLSDVLLEDLQKQAVLDRIAAIVISGDLINRGRWDDAFEWKGKKISGVEFVRRNLKHISNKLDVLPEHFFIVPGNHDIVRDNLTPEQIKDMRINYKHENGFRQLREKFCKIYRLSPLNYCVSLQMGSKKIAFGLLNSAYLNDLTDFSEYGYVGDGMDDVFEWLKDQSDSTKILVLHHHLLPVSDVEQLGRSRKISVTLDAGKILRRSQEVGIGLVLHGHQHLPRWFKYLSTGPSNEVVPSRRQLGILAGGSTGAAQTRLPPNDSNTYSLIDFSNQVPQISVRRIYGSLRASEPWSRRKLS